MVPRAGRSPCVPSVGQEGHAHRPGHHSRQRAVRRPVAGGSRSRLERAGRERQVRRPRLVEEEEPGSI